MDNMNNGQQTLQFEDVASMVRRHNVEVEEERHFRRQQEIRRTARKRDIKRGIISTALAVSLTTAVIAASSKIYQQTVGGNHLANGLYNELHEEQLGHREDSQAGYIFNKGNEYISYGEAVDVIKDQAEELGYNDEETYVAVRKLYNPTIAKDVVGEENIPDFSEKYEARQDAYHERQLGR